MYKIFLKNVNFNKGEGATSGSSCKVIIPQDLLIKFNITREENEVIMYIEADKIVINQIHSFIKGVSTIFLESYI